MGAACSSDSTDKNKNKMVEDGLDDSAVEDSMKSSRQMKFSLRTRHEKSLFRVGSLVFKRRPESGQTAVKKATDYSHVHDAVMVNFSERGQSHHGVPSGVVGLRNLGNTCFINSSLQCLSNTIPLTDYFLGYDYRKEINHDNFLGTGGKLVTAYAELMKSMWLGGRKVVEPSAFKRDLSRFAPQFAGSRQHDAQELLGFLLDGIHEDLNRVKKKPYVEDKDCDGTNDEQDAIEAWKNYLRRNKSLIVDLFQGQFRNTCHCKMCQHKNIRFEPFMYLSLPISDECKTLEDCLSLYLRQEELTGDNKWYCEKCKDHVDATKKIDIWVMPPILIIHLKRFRHDEYGRAGRKNEQPLKYPLQQWNLSSKIHSKAGANNKYDLYAISNHLGGLGGGHYTAYGLNRFNDKWYEFNDSSCHVIDPSTFERSGSPYLLFYNRCEDTNIDGPLNERAPMIRRQSVSRPEEWPHAQVREGQFRDFTRSSLRTFPEIDLDDTEKSTTAKSRRSPMRKETTALDKSLDENSISEKSEHTSSMRKHKKPEKKESDLTKERPKRRIKNSSVSRPSSRSGHRRSNRGGNESSL